MKVTANQGRKLKPNKYRIRPAENKKKLLGRFNTNPKEKNITEISIPSRV